MKKWFRNVALWIAGKLNRWFKKTLAEENEKQFRKNQRILNARRKAAIACEQNNCDHIAGSSLLSDCRDLQNRTAIMWHTSDLGITFGICKVCLRQFWPSDPDYSFWRVQPSTDRLSGAGRRLFVDPRAVAEKFLREEVRPFELDPNPRRRPGFSNCGYIGVPPSAPEEVVHELDSLSDSAIENLWNEVRASRGFSTEKKPTDETPPPSSRLNPNTDPWFLNQDGTPDLFAEANVDFSAGWKDVEDSNDPAA
jgi:hypothetical protein